MNCKFYSEEIGKCLFDGPPNDCPFDNKEEECACFRPIEENKEEFKDIMKCKYYSDYDSGQHDFGVCHYDEYKYGGFPMICTHKDSEENCTCFERESEVEKRFKENLDQIMCIKISKLIGDLKECMFVYHARVIDNCLGNFIVIDCTNDKIYTYSHAEYSWERWPKESGKVTLQSDKVRTKEIMLDNSRSMDTTTLTIQNCDKIILKPRSLEVEVKIEKDNFDDFDSIVINGHRFKRA